MSKRPTTEPFQVIHKAPYQPTLDAIAHAAVEGYNELLRTLGITHAYLHMGDGQLIADPNNQKFRASIQRDIERFGRANLNVIWGEGDDWETLCVGLSPTGSNQVAVLWLGEEMHQAMIKVQKEMPLDEIIKANNSMSVKAKRIYTRRTWN